MISATGFLVNRRRQVRPSLRRQETGRFPDGQVGMHNQRRSLVGRRGAAML
jgi:hypothetical protein